MHPDQAELMQRRLGWDSHLAAQPHERAQLRNYIALQLAAAGLLPRGGADLDFELAQFSRGLVENLLEKTRLLAEYRAPVDKRIESFLNRYFERELGAGEPLRLPARTLVLDRHGIARELSLPAGGDRFENELVQSSRCANGVLNNPRFDRRTTAGTFHIVEGELPIPGDKRAVPPIAFVNLFRAAMQPPEDLMVLPYTSRAAVPSRTWVSLLLRPLVCPEVQGYCRAKTMETRFFAPASLVSNLDFVESIFGNAGDPLVPDHDSALDVERWSGHTGCVILAPHLTQLTKKELGLPHVSEATQRQQADSMCWSDPEEKYNDGNAFKITCRDSSGVIVTLIADNYYGYCKKEVKTQISYAANLMGGVEEEHAGGALAFASYSLGDEFQVNSRRYNGRTFDDVARDYADEIDVHPEGYAVDRMHPSVIYIPENAKATLHQRCVLWEKDGKEQRIPLVPGNVYIAPSGYQIRLEKHPAAPSWRLVGTVGEGIVCHKPCTVSGGGKSEISKSLRDYMLYGPIFVADVGEDFARLKEIFSRDYGDRWNPNYEDRPQYKGQPSRGVLDPDRSLGSLIKLLTPSPDYSDEYNAWLRSIPDHLYAIAFIIKRFVQPEWSENWQDRFGVDIVNGSPGHELKFGNRKLVGTYLRVGLDGDRWRTFKLRQDFIAAAKVQLEDDITASVVVPGSRVENPGPAVLPQTSYKFVANCEYRLFQRPDDAIHRGLDKQTEWDLSQPGNFLCNYQPLSVEDVRRITSDVIDFDEYTEPMKQMLGECAKQSSGYVVATSHPRVMEDGTVTKNPRYLQDRPDLVRERDSYVARRGMQLFRALKPGEPLHAPVGAILSGRRNNPPSQGRPLAVYSPLHYQELPELFMDYISSLSGKSPSTTGAGSEGALTKGPFNALAPTADLNAALVGMILTGLGGFSTPAGFIGPRYEVGHDISLLIPEIWCRLGPHERDPQNMIAEEFLEPIRDFEHNGQKIPASRLGYRITERFVSHYMGRVFDNPAKVLTAELLRPEEQDRDAFAEGVLHIAEMQQKIAQRYLDDGTIRLACPPLQALLHIMAEGSWHGHTIDSEEVRQLFTRDSLLASDWYRERLATKRHRDIALWRRHVESIEQYIRSRVHADTVADMQLERRLEFARRQLQRVESDAFEEEIIGTLGADPMRAAEVVPESAGARLAASPAK